ncbi:uncharacterized protein METZ01_LOCUS494849 [marine metagenome]|uniref:Uncharacterized protein n=1 Tax=marine metagenome TaxID=408172 RepID=A0A383DCL0_9ZZZZ
MRKTHFIIIILFFCILPFSLNAHRSGCHRWHSCPSDSGSYICGDIGYCSACPDNQFCENRSPRASKSEEVVKESKNKDIQKCDIQKDIQKYYEAIGGKIDLKTLSPKEKECILIIHQIVSKSNAPKASNDCRDAWDQANSYADEVVSSAEDLISCVKRSNNRNDCSRYARDVRYSQQSYESAVSDVETYCD